MLYKTMNGTAGVYGHGAWSLPTKNDDGTWTPGEWMPAVKPVLCKSGYHYCRDMSDLLTHLGPEIYEVEVRGEIVEGDDKACASEARLLRRLWADTWTPESQRLFAVDCARRVAHLSETPELTHACLDVTAAFAMYGAEWHAALEAAWGAAWKATRAAARSAGRSAARAAAWAAAWDAARAAAWDAASAAARAAAWDAQVGLLQRYLDGEQGPLVESDL